MAGSGRLGQVSRVVDNSGGTPSTTFTVVDQGAAYAEATIANNLATLTAAVNQIIDALHKKGIMDR
jgi:hypothetical protein